MKSRWVIITDVNNVLIDYEMIKTHVIETN